MKTTEGTFPASVEKGAASFLLLRPAEAKWLLVLGHGASTNMRHATLQAIAEHLADVGIATFRYNFPYSETGTGRNSNAVCMESIRSAISVAHDVAGDLRLLAGGHSFSGRMTSMAYAEEPLPNVHGLVFFAFPLHPSGKPAVDRAEHLSKVNVPMLFLSGTRDKLAEADLLEPVCTGLGPNATLRLLDTADHGFKVLKRSRKLDVDVFTEMASAVDEWARNLK